MSLVLQTACALALSLFSHNIAGYTITQSAPALTLRAAASNTACAVASASSAAFVSAFPSAAQVLIPADVAYDCLESVPNRPQPALDLVQSLRRWMQFQSSIEYLKDPPEGYLQPKVDIYGTLEEIEDKVKRGEYKSEYDMQIDIIAMVNSAHDGHLAVNLDLATQVFYYTRSVELVAVSADGLDIPQIYAASDLVEIADDGSRSATSGLAPSPVVRIDAKDVVSFLLAQATVDLAQDPDAGWNAVFLPIYQQGGGFGSTTYYPGKETTLTFANGTSTNFPNYAIVEATSLDGIQTGDDAYDAFCWTENTPASTASTASPSQPTEPTTGPEQTSIPPPALTVPGYPYPAIKHSADSIAGYYLNDSDYKDVAVLRVADFSPSTVQFNEKTYQEEFQEVSQKFLAACTQLGKKHLIIDLQGNPGGFIDSGTDFFAQLFPMDAPNSKTNMRASVGLEIIMEQASANVSAAEKTPGTSDDIDAEWNWTPFAYQSVVGPEMEDFGALEDFYGPQKHHNGEFTAYFQNNYTDPNASDYQGQGIIITGTNSRTGFHQPFNAKDIVILYDGICHSTCTVISEYLKNYVGVQSIVVGGRPQVGAMQGVGGVKGLQVFGWDETLYSAWQLFQNAPDNVLAQADDTIWSNWTDVAWARSLASSVNGRNHFRMGDDTETPLQFVYEAADCRLWYTPEMLYSPVFLWNRVAEVAFKDRSGTQMNSQYCVSDSSGQPTSISGGWKYGTLGPQTPPGYAKATPEGWPLSGKVVGAAGDGKVDSAALQSFRDACKQYQGNKWLVRVMCGAIGK